MIASSPKKRMDSATVWFYVLTYACIIITGLLGAVGLGVLNNLHPGLTQPQAALGGAVVLGLVLLSGNATLLVMIFYDPKRRAVD